MSKKGHFTSVCCSSKKVQQFQEDEESSNESSDENCLQVETISLVQTKAKQWFADVSLFKSHIKLCLLLWFDFSKTMSLLLSVLRDFSVRWRKITLGLNRIQSAHSCWWHFCSQREPTWENTDTPTGGELVHVGTSKVSLNYCYTSRVLVTVFRPNSNYSNRTCFFRR